MTAEKTGWDFAVLGPVGVYRDGVAVVFRPSTVRLLAALLCRAGRRVGVSDLIEAVWPDGESRTARKALQVYVHRLRRALGADRVEHVGGGYRLVVESVEVDALRFADLLRQGQAARAAGELDRARTVLWQGLALWRGEAFAEARGGSLVAEEVLRLAELRALAQEEYLIVELNLGRHVEILAELTVWIRADPYREQLRACLMLALYRANRRAEALELFRHTHALFIDELGIEPGTTLQRLHDAILRDDPMLATTSADRLDPPVATRPVTVAAPAPVRQLPADVAGFAGRLKERKELAALPADEFAVAVLTGTAGVGKTALAVSWAHQISDRFPDGQLYINLQAHSPGEPVAPSEALARFLQAFGVPGDRIPGELAVGAAMYRSLLADRRVLVVLDNAASAEQVRPLLPAGKGCLVLVTSRHRLDGLVAVDGARLISLDVLPPSDAVAVLAHVVGSERVNAEAEATLELAKLCAYLPLALRIAAANIVGQPTQTIAGYSAVLAGADRVTTLQVNNDEQAAVRRAFDQSYANLEEDARRLFRLFGLMPGTDLAVQAAALLADTGLAGAQRLLTVLTGAHLLGETAPDRYTCHDLLRLYAAGRAIDEESEPARQAAIGRLMDGYLATATAAIQLLYPEMKPDLPVARRPSGSPLDEASSSGGPLDGTRDALAWLDAERPNLVAAACHAAKHGPWEKASHLAELLRPYFWHRGHPTDWRTVARAGLSAAEAASDRPAQARARISLASASWRQDQLTDATEEFTLALRLARQAGHPALEATALGSLGAVYRQAGRPKDAVEPLTRALALTREAGQVKPAHLGRLASVHWELGELRSAAQGHREVYAMYVASGSRSGQAVALANLGETHYLLGEATTARDELERALTLYREVGNRSGAAQALCCLARLHADADRRDLALQLAHAALALAEESERQRTRAEALSALGAVHQRQGHPEQAADGYVQAVQVARAIGVPYVEAEALIGLGTARLDLNQAGQASVLIGKALAIAVRAGYRLLESQARQRLADIQHHGRTLRSRRASSSPVSPADLTSQDAGDTGR